MRAAPISFRYEPVVTRQRVIRLTRRLPVGTDPRLEPGERVAADEPIGVVNAKALVVRVDLAERLRVSPNDAAKHLLHPVGAAISAGAPLAKVRRGLRNITIPAPITGTIVEVEPATGLVSIVPAASDQPLAHVDGYMAGSDRDTIELLTVASRVTGCIGLGRPVAGRLLLGSVDAPDLPLDPERLSGDLNGTLVVAGGAVDAATLSTLAERGVAGVVAGSVTIDAISELLGVTGDARLAFWRPNAGSGVIGDGIRPPLALIVSEGIGTLPMHPNAFALLAECEGEQAVLFPETRFQPPILRPQLLIPAEGMDDLLTSNAETDQAVALTPGRLVRLTTQSDLGMFATILREPRQHPFANNPRGTAVDVTLLQGGTRTVPVANLEVIS